MVTSDFKLTRENMQNSAWAKQMTDAVSCCLQAASAQEYELAMQREMAAREARWGSGMTLRLSATHESMRCCYRGLQYIDYLTLPKWSCSLCLLL